jgi:hypothetical protein
MMDGFEVEDDDVHAWEEEYDESSYFYGECTCDHDEGEHTWGHCGVDNCPCEAGWKE